MATTHRHPVPDADSGVIEPEVVTSPAARKALAVLRIGFGLTFLWAFFDKLLPLGIGAALTFGIGMRIAAGTGALLYLLMWSVSMPLANNPVIDDHLLGAVSVVVLALTLSGDTWGFGKRWARTHLVRANGWLR
jgi:hypothetical protein